MDGVRALWTLDSSFDVQSRASVETTTQLVNCKARWRVLDSSHLRVSTNSGSKKTTTAVVHDSASQRRDRKTGTWRGLTGHSTASLELRTIQSQSPKAVIQYIPAGQTVNEHQSIETEGKILIREKNSS